MDLPRHLFGRWETVAFRNRIIGGFHKEDEWEGRCEMKAILAEAGKVCRSRLFLFVLVCLLGVNLFCLWDTANSGEYSPTEYRGVWDEIMEQPAGERLTFGEEKQAVIKEELREAGLYVSRESVLYEDVVSELVAANSYEDFIEELGRKKDLITGSVLFREENSFSTRSAEKAYTEYTEAEPPVIAEAPSKGVELVNLTVTDLLAACAGIFACVVLFVREREQDMVRLQWTLKKGRLQHLWYKLAALFFCATGLALLFYGSNYLFASFSYGLGPLSRDIRMVETYAHSIKGYSVGIWLGLNLGLKILVLYVMLLLCSLCCTLLKGMVSVVLCFAGILLAEFLMYSGIAATSVYSPFRYVNLIALFQNQEWLLQYKHINVFGHPVNYGICAVVLLVVLFFCGIAGSCFGYRCYGKRLEHRSAGRLRKEKRRRHVRTNLMRLELWKAFVMQRLLPMVLGLLLVQIIFYVRNGISGVSINEYYYKAYMTRLEGPATEETPELLNEIFMEATAARSSLAMDAYEQVVERYEYLKEHGGCFVYDTGFGILSGEIQKNKDALLTLKIMLVILLFSSSVFSYDPQKRMAGLLHSTVKGEKQVPIRKYLICASFSVLVGVAVYLPDFLQVTRQYEVHGYSYPAVSLPWLMQYGEGISIGGYLMLLYAVRLLLCPVTVVFIMVAAERLKSFVYTFFACGAVLVCIPLLTMLNPSWTVLAYPLYGIYGNPLLQGEWFGIFVYFGLVTVGIILTLRGRRKLWN